MKIRPSLIVLGFLFGTIFFQAPSVASELQNNAVLREASQTFIKGVLDEILSTPETAKYFPGAKRPEVPMKARQWHCWTYAWDYSLHVNWVQDDTPYNQRGIKPIFEGRDAIRFSLFVAGNGMWRISAVQTFPVLDNRRLTAGFDLSMADSQSDLKARIDAIIEAHLPAFQKAIASVKVETAPDPPKPEKAE